MLVKFAEGPAIGTLVGKGMLKGRRVIHIIFDDDGTTTSIYESEDDSRLDILKHFSCTNMKIEYGTYHRGHRTLYRPLDSSVVRELVVRPGNGPYFSGDKFTLETTDVVLDIGANIGLNLAVIASFNCEKVIALEPDVEAFKLLEKNSRNITSDRPQFSVKLVRKAAVAEGSKSTLLHLHPKIPSRNTMMEPKATTLNYRTSTVETITLSELLDIHSDVTVVKIDIQGGENELVTGISNWKNVRMVVMEYDFEYCSRVAEYEEFIERMRKMFPIIESRKVRSDDNGNFIGFPTGCVVRMKIADKKGI